MAEAEQTARPDPQGKALAEELARHFLGPNIGVLATIRQDGTPHVTPVWIDYDGSDVVVNTAAGRQKWQHLRRDPRATVLALPSPYEYVEVSGAAELTEEGADEHIDALAHKYMGVDRYPYRAPDERRVIVRVRPERVSYWRAPQAEDD